MQYERWAISPELEAKMRDVARQLRREPTPTEAILWQQLRRKQLGQKFRRQAPIGPFRDFLCTELHLVIEVDGPIHTSQVKADHERQTLLESLGLRFVRFSAEEVETHLPEVVNQIRAALNERNPNV